MRILTIIPNTVDDASTRFRVVQYAALLGAEGFEFDYVNRKAITQEALPRLNDYDVILNNRCLFRRTQIKRLLLSGIRTVYDYDDAVYTRPGRPHSLFTAIRVQSRFRLWVRHATVVSAANRVLADYAGRFRQSVHVVPMALDLRHWQPRSQPAPDADTITVGWIGSPVNLPQIELLDAHLNALCKKHSNVKLAIFCGTRPAMTCPFAYHPFAADAERDFVQGLDIGLLPLEEDAYLAGKSPIKAVQYLACGVPVIANIFGGTREILNSETSLKVENDNWFSLLEQLITERGLRERLGQNGRDFALRHHNLHKTVHRFRSLLSGGTE